MSAPSTLPSTAKTSTAGSTAAPTGTLKKTALYAFDTDIGWMGVLWDGQRVLRNVFGHEDLGEVHRRVAAEVATEQPEISLEVKTDIRGQQLRQIVKFLKDFSKGKAIDFSNVPLDLDHLTTFQSKVIESCRDIPHGETRSYKQIASDAGSPRAARAVGNVMRSNRFPLIIPCHRVVASGGLGGYSAPDGLDMKRRLLNMEQS